MNIHGSKRLFVVAAVLGAVALFATGFFVALGVRSVVAGPDAGPAASPPNPGHSWSQIGDLPGTMWHSNNDGTGSGLDADTLDGLQSTQIQDADDYVSTAASAGNADMVDGKHSTQIQDADDYVSNAGYATSAGNADMVDGHHATYFQRRVIGTCAAGSSIRVIDQAGTVSCETDDAGLTACSQCDGTFVNEADLDHLDAADGSPANAVYVDNAGRVGIGDSTPDYMLDVDGEGYFDDGIKTGETASGDGIRFGKKYSLAADINPIVTSYSGYVWWDYSARTLYFVETNAYGGTAQVAGYAEEGTGTAFKHSWCGDTWGMATLTHNGDHASFDITSEGPNAGYIHIFALYSNSKLVAHYSYRYQ